MQKEYLEVGKIINVHALKGEVCVAPWCNGPEFLCQFSDLYLCNNDNSKTKLKVEFSQPYRSAVLIKFDSINNREQAEKLKGKILFILRKDAKLKNNEYFFQDILGCSVYNIDTEKYYGKITEIFQTGANDVYQITSDTKKNYLIPVINSVVIEIDPQEQQVLIRPMEGIFDDEN